ncbi:MAG: TetR/AcrR family transcriptional regulator [Myxococcota bacterium]
MSVANLKKPKAAYHHGDLREALLKAAEIELADKGVEAFSLRAVAKRAGVSHGAPAHHFDDAAGLLTQLAAKGYGRFIRTQKAFQRKAAKDPASQLAASGLGYIDFAVKHTALFKLMFSSERTNRQDPALSAGADAAFDKLVEDVSHVLGRDPHHDEKAMADVMSAWVIAHGLADLMIARRFERMEFFAAMSTAQRHELFSEIILRAIHSQSDGDRS